MLLSRKTRGEICGFFVLVYNESMVGSRDNLEDRLDAIFSLYVRLRYADHAGYVACYTCTRRFMWSEVDCGHWKPRANHGTRWEDDNCAAQCSECNRVFGGRPETFEENLRDDLGDARVARLETLASDSVHFSDEELKEKLIHYTRLVAEMGKVV